LTAFANAWQKQTAANQGQQEIEQEKLRKQEEEIQREHQTRQQAIEEEKRRKEEAERARNEEQQQIEESIAQLKGFLPKHEENELSLVQQLKENLNGLEGSLATAGPPPMKHHFQIMQCTACITQNGVQQCQDEISEYQARVWPSA